MKDNREDIIQEIKKLPNAADFSEDVIDTIEFVVNGLESEIGRDVSGDDIADLVGQCQLVSEEDLFEKFIDRSKSGLQENELLKDVSFSDLTTAERRKYSKHQLKVWHKVKSALMKEYALEWSFVVSDGRVLLIWQ